MSLGAARFPDNIPPGVIVLMVIWIEPGACFKLNRPPHYVDAHGWSVFHLNAAKVDVIETGCEIQRQMFGAAVSHVASDRRYEQMLRDRAERELAEKQAKAAA